VFGVRQRLGDESGRVEDAVLDMPRPEEMAEQNAKNDVDFELYEFKDG
jgi:hypothetical protein